MKGEDKTERERKGEGGRESCRERERGAQQRGGEKKLK